MEVMGEERDYIIHNAAVIKGFFGEFRWLSNFHRCEIYFDGFMFPSTENAYVYAKMDIATIDEVIFKDTLEKLLVCSPAESKKLGRTFPLREDWELIKFDVMSAVVFDKFYRHVELRKQLLSTGYKHIEETNHWKDVYWGVCDGKGHNQLGKIHMAIRDYWAKQYPELLNKKKATQLF